MKLRRKIALGVIAFFVAYAVNYYLISRRGIREAKPYGISGFLYVPIDPVMKSQDLSSHHRFTILFFPANWIDQNLFGGPAPVQGILFRLGGAD